MSVLLLLIFIVLLFYFVQLVSKVFAIFVVGFLIWSYFNQNYLYERFTSQRQLNSRGNIIPFAGWGEKQYHHVQSHNLEKPKADNGLHPIYQWWKYDHKTFQERLYKDCDQYRCQNKLSNGYSAQPYFNLINGSYKNPAKNLMDVTCYNSKLDNRHYNDLAQYCLEHADDQSCPNYWVGINHPMRADSSIKI